MTREKALKMLDELKNSPNMKKHGLGCGFAMVALFDCLKEKGQNPELDRESWEIVGILHDADYEATDKSIEKHTDLTSEKLKEVGADQIIIDAIRGHCDKSERKTLIAKSIYAADELTGLIVACALVRPEKKLSSLTVESILKKFRDKSFAAGANRDQIKTCESDLNVPLEDFAGLILKSMQEKSRELGL